MTGVTFWNDNDHSNWVLETETDMRPDFKEIYCPKSLLKCILYGFYSVNNSCHRTCFNCQANPLRLISN